MPYSPKRGQFAGLEFKNEHAYRNFKAQSEGYSSYYQKQHSLPRTDWQLWGKVVERVNKKTGEVTTHRWAGWIGKASENLDIPVRDIIRPNSTFNKLYQAAKRDNFDKRAHGPLATLLEYTQLRETNAEYNVGDTPGT